MEILLNKGFLKKIKGEINGLTHSYGKDSRLKPYT
jgi:hypothetical protein